MRKDIIVVHESVRDGIIKDCAHLAAAAAVIALGWSLDSSAMQWVGFSVFLMLLLAYSTSSGKPRQTPQQAADYLRDTYGVTAAPARQP